MSLRSVMSANLRSKYSVFGFIRQIEKSLNGWNNIPMAIKYLCLNFYFLFCDKFTEKGSNIEITKEGTTAICKTQYDLSTMLANGVFGKEIINLNTTDAHKEYHWSLKLSGIDDKDKEHQPVRIGITNSKPQGTYSRTFPSRDTKYVWKSGKDNIVEIIVCVDNWKKELLLRSRTRMIDVNDFKIYFILNDCFMEDLTKCIFDEGNFRLFMIMPEMGQKIESIGFDAE